MSGIMVAVAGNAQNIVYVSGLYIVETNTAQQSPIFASASNTTITRNWIGYFLSPSTGSVSLAVQVTADAGGFDGSASTTGRLWLGNNAAAGVNNQADITITRTSGSGTSTVNFNLVQGVYYPLRIRWNGSYSSSTFGFESSGSITFLASGSSNVSDRIFYNSLTNGF
jgi:hypothetical protein